MLYSQVNKKFNKNIHEKLKIDYYNLISRMRAPVGKTRSTLYTSMYKPKKLAEVERNHNILKKYYTKILRNTKYTSSHPTMKAFKNKLNEYNKYIKQRKTAPNNKKPITRKTTNRAPVPKPIKRVLHQKGGMRSKSVKRAPKPQWRY